MMQKFGTIDLRKETIEDLFFNQIKASTLGCAGNAMSSAIHNQNSRWRCSA